jgi:hypothetical protein
MLKKVMILATRGMRERKIRERARKREERSLTTGYRG